MSRISDLAHALHRKTIERKLSWDVIDDASVVVNVGKNAITVVRFDDDYLGSGYALTIQNLDGKTVDSENFFAPESTYEIIAEMVTRAKRDALRVDETLDEIMKRVNSM